MDSSRFHILCQDEFLGFEQNDENGENFLEKREKEKLGVEVKWPPKVRQYFEVKIIQAAERACCLWIAGGKPFSFALILRLL